MTDPTTTEFTVTPQSILGIGWQNTKDTAATTGLLHIAKDRERGTDFEVFKGQENMEVGGRNSSGDIMIGGDREAFRRPGGRLVAPLNSHLATLCMESVFGGRVTTADGDLTEASDTGNDLSSWALTGARIGANTDSSRKIYVDLIDESPAPGEATVNLYSDSGRSALIATGNGANSTTIALADSNNSGLSGTVDLATPAATNQTITLTINKVTFVRALKPTDDMYITLVHDDGVRKYTSYNCVCSSLKFIASRTGAIMIEAEFIGMKYLNEATSLTESVFDTGYLIAGQLQLTYDTASANAILPLETLEAMFVPDWQKTPEISAANYTDFAQDGWDINVSGSGKVSDEMRVLITDAQAVTNTKSLLWKMTWSNVIFNIAFSDHLIDPEIGEKIEGGVLSPIEFNGKIKADGATISTAAYFQWAA